MLKIVVKPKRALRIVVTPKPKRLCAYCDDAPATGYVSSYKAHICATCYCDYHCGSQGECPFASCPEGS